MSQQQQQVLTSERLDRTLYKRYLWTLNTAIATVITGTCSLTKTNTHRVNKHQRKSTNLSAAKWTDPDQRGPSARRRAAAATATSVSGRTSTRGPATTTSRQPAARHSDRRRRLYTTAAT